MDRAKRNAELRELLAKATKGEWKASGIAVYPAMDGGEYDSPTFKTYDNAELCAKSHNVLPDLLKDSDALEAAQADCAALYNAVLKCNGWVPLDCSQATDEFYRDAHSVAYSVINNPHPGTALLAKLREYEDKSKADADEIAMLRAIVDKLPKTADGVSGSRLC